MYMPLSFFLSFLLSRPLSVSLRSSEAAPNVPQRGVGAVQHFGLPALPRPLLPCHLPLGEGQLHPQLPLHLLWRLLRAGAGGGHAPKEGRVPLHGHRGRLQGGGHFLPTTQPLPPAGRLAGLHRGTVTAAGRGHTVAPLTLWLTLKLTPHPYRLPIGEGKEGEPLLLGRIGSQRVRTWLGKKKIYFFFSFYKGVKFCVWET